jgi:PAS domain S-box-containing protein
MRQARKRPRVAPSLARENEELRRRLEEAEETLRAIRAGEIDGLVVEGPRGRQVYTLRGADESYRTLVEAMNEGALVLEPGGTILYANMRFSEIVRTPLPQVIGANVRAFLSPAADPAFDRLISGGAEVAGRHEATLLRGDGGPVPVLLSAAPIRIEQRSGIGVLVTDLTEIRLHAASLEKANRDLAATNQELEAFVYSVSHDLRAPLRSVHRYATMILEDHAEGLPQEVKDHLRLITAGAVRMDDLIRDLLAYSHVSRQEITLSPVDTASVVTEVLKNLTGDIRERQADVAVDGGLPAVVGDAVLLSQAISNLLSNALKFVPPGTHPRVRIHAESRGPTVRLWVDDNGIGIADQAKGRLFRLFERLTREYPGTGIGLAIVKRAIERMGGEVGLESRAGHGTRFWIDLRALGSERR